MSRLTRVERTVALAAAGVLTGGLVALAQPGLAQAGAAGGGNGAASAVPAVRVVPTGTVGAGRVAAPAAVLPLVESRAETVLPGAVPDPGPSAMPDGTVATPRAATVLADAPDGRAVGILPVTTIGGAPTSVPVIAARDGWLQVLLPSRPASSTAWLRATDVTTAHSRWAIEVSLSARALTLLHDGAEVGVWRVAVGLPATPTPVTRTFVAALLRESTAETQILGPWVLALGAHSPVLATFDGGPGTIGIHGWPEDARVFGTAASNGCVRAPADALAQLTQVPLGSPVVITS